MVLQYQLAYVKHTLGAASQRKERLEELMSRKSAKKWDAKKKATMVRKLVTATQTVEQCVAAVDEISKKLEQVLAQLGPAPANNVAPFVKAPPTSEIDEARPPTPVADAVNEIESPFGA